MVKHTQVAIQFIFFSVLPCIQLIGQTSETDTARPISIAASYTGDLISNMNGGIKSGGGYLGLANILVNFNTEDLGLWKGGSFKINGANTHGATPSATYIGDMQVASNIEAGDHTFLQELYYHHTFGKLEVIVGLQDMNSEFATADYAALFINSSFGMLPVISNNIDAPIFPLTALGVTASIELNDNTQWVNALYDGCPTGFNHDPYNMRWNISAVDGILGISEFQFKTKNESERTIKVGIFSHYHKLENENIESTPDSLNTATLGTYGYLNQQIWNSEKKNIGLFAQLGYSPSDASTNDFYLGAGINFTGIFNKKGKDTFGIAFAYEHFNLNLASETAIELTYHFQVNESLFLQPDIQYIVNPAGTGETLNNALAGALRFGIEI